MQLSTANICQIQKNQVILQKLKDCVIMKKIFSSVLLLAAVVLLLDSCANGKNFTYFENMDEVSLAASKGLYDARIMPKDELTITVGSTEPEASASFNLMSMMQTNNGLNQMMQKNYTYLVENDGTINFPHLGRIKCVGMTKLELQNYITEQIAPYFSADEHPIVTVRMSNYRVTVIGEVGGARVVDVNSEKMSIIEALASAGDLGLHGKRDKILLVREDATGEKSAHMLDIHDANIFNSPYYYVQQNDIIYVNPDKIKARTSNTDPNVSTYMSYISFLLGLATLLVGIFK